ncbi:MAG: hypothetical protein ACLRT5_07010 [Lachnospiraceae bacterium]
MEGTVALEIEGHVFLRERGELLFTDYGISGIPVFQISRYAVRACREGNQSALPAGSDAGPDPR